MRFAVDNSKFVKNERENNGYIGTRLVYWLNAVGARLVWKVDLERLNLCTTILKTFFSFRLETEESRNLK